MAERRRRDHDDHIHARLLPATSRATTSRALLSSSHFTRAAVFSEADAVENLRAACALGAGVLAGLPETP